MADATLEFEGTTYRLAVLRGPELEQLVPLYRRAFRRRFFNPAWLARKYACEAGGVSAFACAAFTETGEAAGSFGVLPWPVRHGDRVEVAGQLVDAATAEHHRRRGLFRWLADMAREQCEAAGVSFLFAFPHQEGGSYPGFVRHLGYDHVDDLVEYRQQTRSVPADEATRRVSPLRRLYERRVERILDARIAADPVLPNSLVVDGFAGVDRDESFHAYKSSFSGSRVLALEGGRVWIKASRGLQIGDLEASTERDLDRTIAELEGLAARIGVREILFQASRETRFTPFFEQRFRTLPGLAVVYRNISSEITREALRFTFGDLDNF